MTRHRTAWLVAGLAMVTAITSVNADALQQARQLVAQFKAVDWDSRAVMVKPPAFASDDQWKLRVITEFELASLGEAIVPLLRESLRDENRHVRALAAYVLGVVGDKSAATALAQALQSDKDPSVRVYASDALGRLSVKESLPAVGQAMNDPSGFVRFSARVASKRIMAGESEGSTFDDAKGLREQFMKLYDRARIAAATVGKAAPDFALTTNGSDIVHLSDFRGKRNVVLLFQLADW